ncbi:MAG: tetratricopeptide repeat-containing sensor histidine kinase [Fulvivirga sp.]
MKQKLTQFHLIFTNTLLGYLKLVFTLILFASSIETGYTQNVQKWKEVFENEVKDQQLVASWELFKHYRTINKDSAYFYAELNNRLSLELSDTLSIIKSFNALGYLNKEDANYANAINNYESGLELARLANHQNQIKFLLNNLALVHTYYGNYDKSLSYHFQSLRIRENENDLKGMAVAYNNIGLVYYQVGDNEKALSYFNQSLELERSINGGGIQESLINIGLVNTSLSNYDEALKAYNEVIEICTENDCVDQVLLKANSGSGIAFIELQDFGNAKIRFLVARNLAIQLEDIVSQIITDYYISIIFQKQNKYDSAFIKLNEASNLVKSTDAKAWKMEIDNLYAELYEEKGNYEKAYLHKNRYSLLRDSIYNEDLIKNLANIQLDYQEAQTQEIIAGKDTQIKRRTQINLMLGGITILISALLFILYKNIQLKKKANRRLAEANEIIEHQNKELTNVNAVLEDRVKERTKELKKTNEALKKSNEELDNFIYKTSHDIRGPLATLMGVCNIAQIDVKDQKALDYFDKLSLTATRLNEILSKLLTINQINNTALQPQKIYVAELVENLAAEQIMNFKNPKIEISVDIEDSLNLTSDLDLLRVIYGNLISNAIKFRDTSDRRDSFINITAAKSNNFIEFNIKDNGIGINETETEKIFEVFSKATDIADSSGIGLYLVKLAVEKLSGSISFEQTEEGYTAFKVILPA